MDRGPEPKDLRCESVISRRAWSYGERVSKNLWTGRPRRWGLMTLLLVAAAGGWVAGAFLVLFAIAPFGETVNVPVAVAGLASLAVAGFCSVLLARIFRP